MATEDIKKEDAANEAPKHHESWVKHVIEEIKEEIDEFVEEAENDGGEFSALGNGHINVVHDHHNHPEEKKDEEKKSSASEDMETDFPLSGGDVNH